MKDKDYRDKCYAYWHMDLPEDERKEIWSEIQIEMHRREKRFFYRVVAIAIFAIVAMLFAYSKCSYGV